MAPDAHEEARLGPLSLPAPPAPPVERIARIDLRLLARSRQLRLLITGQGISSLGSMVTSVALPFQAYHLTHSTLVVGLLSLAEFVPLLATAFLGGALADAIDRRRLILASECAMGLATVGLLVNATAERPQLWPLFVVGAAITTAYGLQRPSLDAIVPRVVDEEDLAPASSLQLLVWSSTMVAGPLLAGLLIAVSGLATTYAVDVVTYAVALLAFAAMAPAPPAPDAGELSLAAVADGLRYARSRGDLLGSYLVDLSAMFFGIPEALIPAVATHYGGAAVVGVLYAAAPIGAFAVSATSGWLGRVTRHGRAIALAAAGWGVGIVVFGFATSLAVAVAGLLIAGGADMVSGLCRTTMWNESIPDRVRGRLAGLEMLSYGSGPTLGNVEAGAAASLVGLRASIVAGGGLCILASAAIALALPTLWRYDAASGRRLRSAATPPPADTPATPAGSSGSTRG
jgi:MFS family permease